ncbi:rhodanese-related sulfurtransferase [Halobacteroides halobius DSM 5150]|uniref:thiosulfate sulfurtransferase n=1 Tax=Halobacteroides halobius (strain ATCC 35273 / DSM 5150 / MD-1) TaxID=748449 RepID=L0K9R5_HALHC|nr:sulfurtransferase [Halobacteroides halobius]AGB41114.1 rhodanese-related sulfurtransferase [Halobacteroides halobius DSM 5150]
MFNKKGAILSLTLVLVFSISLVAGAFWGFGDDEPTGNYIPIDERGYANPDALISAKRLKEIKDREDVVVVDFRHEAKYFTGHIPGAVQVYRSDEENPNAKYGGMRATPEQMEKMLESKGISNGDLIVIYDDRADYDAARMWWILKMYGYDKVKLLDGGIVRWKALDYETNLLGADVKKGNFEFDQAEINREKWLATLEDVKQAIDSPNTVILDTRTWAEHTGEKTYTDRRGHIPTSVWIEWKEAVNGGKSNGPRTFKTAKELRKIYQAKGVTKDKTIIPYCQSAVRSSHTTFVLTQLLGYDHVKNFDGSWIMWSAHKELPVEKGE